MENESIIFSSQEVDNDTSSTSSLVSSVGDPFDSLPSSFTSSDSQGFWFIVFSY